jgi:hypothetical protein
MMVIIQCLIETITFKYLFLLYLFMGSVLASTVRYRDVFPGDFKDSSKFRELENVQIFDPELDKQFSGTFEDDNDDMAGFYSGHPDFDDLFGRKKEYPQDDVIIINPHEPDAMSRKRTLVHEMAHKVSRTPGTFSERPKPKEIIDSYFSNERQGVGQVLRDYKPSEFWNELVSMQAETNPLTLLKNPEKKYEKEFFNQYKSENTQRRLFEPSLVEYPLDKDYNFFEKSGVKWVGKSKWDDNL